MPSIFEKIDKIRPLYDAVYKFVLFICKLLLVVDIAITSPLQDVISHLFQIRHGLKK